MDSQNRPGESNATWSLYFLETGLFAGVTFTGPRASLAAHTPEKLGAIEGHHDHLCRRVDLSVAPQVEALMAQMRALPSCALTGGCNCSNPEECAAARQRRKDIQSEIDALIRRQIVDHQPPQPSPDHEWKATTRRWELSAAAKERQARRRAAQAQIAALETAQHRPLRALALNPAAAEARKRLEVIEAAIASLRGEL